VVSEVRSTSSEARAKGLGPSWLVARFTTRALSVKESVLESIAKK
jgi:hypothetical protein